MNVICFGDSITHAAGAEKHRWPTILQGLLDQWRPDAYVVYNRGVGGHTTAQGLERVKEDVFSLLPGVVLVEFGFNDANCRDWLTRPRVGVVEYRENLVAIGTVIRREGGTVVMMINHLPGTGSGQGDGADYIERIQQYNTAAREAAAELDVATIDLPEIMSRRDIDLKHFLKDSVHLTPEGNGEYSDMVYGRLREILPELDPAVED